ncbi:MAG: aminotransferase class IV [Sphingobacteriia bacterium]|nr:aminotransferase class IV [Sphingobacteriia bacterium]
MQENQYIWFDNKQIFLSEAKIPLLTHGLHYASSVFEGIRVYNGTIFMLEEHIDRLFISSQLLDMKINFSKQEILTACHNIVKANFINNGYIRPFVWRGSERIQIAAPHSTIHVAIAAWEAGERYKAPLDLTKGQRLITGDFKRPPAECMPYKSKCAGNYTIGTIEKHKAIAKGYDDALLLDYRGYIAESTSANIFLIINDELHTPIPDCFLNGLTRQTIIQLANKIGIKIVERHIMGEELKQAKDVFITSTTLEIMPINAINNYIFSRHQITNNLMNEFIALASIKFAV